MSFFNQNKKILREKKALDFIEISNRLCFTRKYIYKKKEVFEGHCVPYCSAGDVFLLKLKNHNFTLILI